MHAFDSSVMSDLFAFQVPAVEKVIRTVAVYLGLAVILRLCGKRLLAQMNSLDLVVVLLLSNVVQNAIIGDDNSLVGGLLGAVVLVLFNAGLDRLASHSAPVRWLLEGSATQFVTEGKVDEGARKKLGMTDEEIDIALHQQGADSIDEVRNASLEPGGTLLVELKPEEEAASVKQLREAVEELKAEIRALRGTV